MSESEPRFTRASDSSESHTTQSETKADTACDSLLGTVKSTLDPFKETFSSKGSTLHHVSEAVNSLASLQGMPSQLLNTGIAQIPLLDKVPGMPAATIGVPHLGTPHAHSHPPSNGFPLPSSGMTIGAGCLSVLIGGIPAARVLDIGFAPTCGGLTPYFDIQTGSSNTFIGGMRAARMGIDMTRHCNPMGHVGKSGGEAASAAEKSEEVASEAAQVSGRAKLLGGAGKAWSVGNAAIGPASGMATAASDVKHHEALAAAMTAAQTAADLAFMMLSNLMGKDPGIEPSMGTLLMGDPTVLIGGFPLPDSQMMWHGAKHGIGKKVRSRVAKRPQELKSECRGEPISAVTGEVKNDFSDYETDEAMPFKWGRHYSSSWRDRAGPLGYGFRHTWQHELQLLRTRAIYTDPQGTAYTFGRGADGRYGGCCQGYVLEQLDGRQFIVWHDVQGAVEFEQISATDGTPCCIGHVCNRVRSRLHWHANGYLEKIEQVDERGHVRRIVQFDHDRCGRILSVVLTNLDGRRTPIARYEYDTECCLVTYRNALNAVSANEYDPQRRIVRLINANGYSFFYRYDTEGRCIESSGQDGMWHVKFQYQPGRTIVTEGDGGKWSVHYNDVGTITRIVDPYGGAIEYALAFDGRITEEIDSGGRVLRWLYNARERNTGRVDQFGNVWPIKDEAPNLPNPLSHKIPGSSLGLQWGWVSKGDFSEMALLPPELEESARQAVTPPPPRFDKSEKRHDVAGQLIQHTDVHGNVERFVYDAAGNLVCRHDGDGSEYRYTLASWNLHGSTRDPLGHTVQYRYASRRKVSAIVDANGNESTYAYDLKNRISQVVRDGMLLENYAYDKGDRLVEKRDGADNVLLRFEVGENGFHSKRILSSGETYIYEYDTRGNVTKASTDQVEITRTFESSGRRTSDKRNDTGVEHAYLDDRLARTTYFKRFDIYYECAADGEILIRTPEGGTHRMHRGADGRILMQLANGTNVVYAFDSQGRCTGRMTWLDERVKAPRTVQYEYSATGELRRVTDSERGTVAYQYDATHRLTGETRDGWPVRRFEYDAAGNLLSTYTLRWMRYTDGNRLSSASSGEFRYNHRNHLAEEIVGIDRRITYHYNSMDQLVKVEWGGQLQTWAAEYDGLCRRVTKVIGTARTEYYWDGDRLAAEIAPNRQIRIYVYANETALLPFMFIDYPSVSASPNEGHAYFTFVNQVGMPEWIENGDRRLVWRAADIDPYGTVFVASGNSIEYDLRWPGHWLDREINLHYNRFRFYSPVLGRYLQSDPMGQAGGINLYAYPSNPVVSVDVLGLSDSHAASEPTEASESIGTGDPVIASPGEHRTAPQGPRSMRPAHKGERWIENAEYPPRTKKAWDECHFVVETMDNMRGNDNRPKYSKSKMPTVHVFLHEDGTVSVGISGDTFDPGEFQRELDNAERGKYTIGRKDNDDADWINFKKKISKFGNGNHRGACAEPGAAHAASKNPSPIIGMATIWRGNKDNPYPTGRWGRSREINPCDTCAHSANIKVYMKHAMNKYLEGE
ncbi:RHS repeat-associated core domain-containing protein [Burkholderia theae]|uniref:RHS repeat-associated core domain-containing protein n=1 Tax=Burkholderia theae TaxID=3143496 RepID=UPI003AFB4CA6